MILTEPPILVQASSEVAWGSYFGHTLIAHELDFSSASGNGCHSAFINIALIRNYSPHVADTVAVKVVE